MKNKLTTKVSLILLMILTFVVLLGVNVGAASTEITSGTKTLTLKNSGEYVLNGDVTRNIKIPSYSDVTIDLNGHVLCGTGNGSVITNNGYLTIKDSNPDALHYYVVNADGSWTWNDAADKTNAVLYASLTDAPTAGTVVCVPGGAITGGNASYGGAINNAAKDKDTYLFLDGGNFIGNVAKKGGGAIASQNKTSGSDILFTSTLTMKNNVKVLGNIVKSDANNTMGGGVYVNSIANLDSCDISYNVSVCTADGNRAYTGGLYFGEKATVTNLALQQELSHLTIVGNITLASGDCSVALGGGISFACQGNIRLFSCTVRGNRVLATGLETAGTARAFGGGAYVYNDNLVLTLKDTTVSDNVAKVEAPKDGDALRYAFGGGIYIGHGTLNINDDDVLISGNLADATYKAQGSGVYMAGNTTFIMTAGKITGNTIKAYRDGDVNEEEGAGVIVTYDSCAFKVGGGAVIVSNTDSLGAENNVYLRENAVISTLPNPTDMRIGVTVVNGVGTITDMTSVPVHSYFFADNADYTLMNEGVVQNYVLKSVVPVCVVTDGALQGQKFGRVKDAFDKASQLEITVSLLCDQTECIELQTGAIGTIDLNGYVLSAPDGKSAIVNGALLTVTDLNTVRTSSHKFVYRKTDAWTLTNTVEDAIGVSAIDEDTLEGTIVIVYGSVITGANGNSAIANSGTMVLENVNIIGNDAAGNNGGGITNGDNGILTLVGCIIAGNKAANGGGIYADKATGGNCFAEGTKITMADGTILPIEDVHVGDKVLSFNHETGNYESQKVMLAYRGEAKASYFTLHFADGNELSIVGCHDLFEQSACRYVTVSTENATEFIGKYFYNAASKSWVKLESVTYCDEKVNFYSIYVAGTINCIANGMLTIPDDMETVCNLYEFNADLTVNAEALQAEIDTYGLLAYEDSPYVLSRETFDALNMRFWNILIGRGFMTTEERDYVYNEWYRDLDLQLTNAQLFGSAVLFSAEVPSNLTISGKTLIFGNVNASGAADNVYLCDGKDICVKNPDADMYVGVTLAGKTGVATTAADDSFAKYFFSDNDEYVAFDTGVAVALQVYIGNPVAVISETNLRYASLTDAIKAADTTPSTIILLCDVTENVTIPDAATITIDLDGYVWQSVADTDEHIIDNNGTLTIIDSNTHNQTHNYKVNAKGVWVLTDDEYTKTFASLTDIPAENDVICVPGGVITGSKLVAIANINTLKIAGGNIIGNAIDDVQAGIIHHHSGEMTITAGNIVGNGIHAVVCEGSTLTMDGGCIAYNNGIGVAIDDESSFYLKNGVIRGNSIGGVNNTGTFLMTGGLITGNKAEMGAGVYSCGTITIGGTAQIYGNTATDCGDNLTIYAPIALGTGTDAPADGMIVGISLLDGDDAIKAGAVTKETTVPYAKYFFSDNDAYVAFNTGKPTAMQVYIGNPVAVISETNLGYPSIKDAIEAAGTTPSTIKLLCDVKENVTIPANADITLDLNGYVLSGDGTTSVIVNYGTATITDSNPTSTHYYVVDANGVWQWNDKATKTDAVNLADLTGIPAAGTIICVPGGAITGGAAVNGGGIESKGTLALEDGTVIGNKVTSNGGGVYVFDSNFTMTGGKVVGNVANTYGGGIYVGKQDSVADFTMIDGNIYGNKASYGGGVYVFKANFTMTGGNVVGNKSTTYGGGVYNAGTFTMNGGTVSDNTAVGASKIGTIYKDGGGVYNADKATFIMTGGSITGNAANSGVYNCGTMTVGGAATITDNKNKDGKASNLYLPSGKTITVQDFNGMVGITTQDAPAAGALIAFTGANDANKTYFFSDNDAYSVIKADATLYLGIPVAQIVETGEKYVSIYDAVTAAGTTPTTIKLLCYVQENVTIPAGAQITLDLCGQILEGAGDSSVIVNYGTLTVTDSNPDIEHYYTVVPTGMWDWNDNEIWLSRPFASFTEIPSEGTIICVPGGAITGGAGMLLYEDDPDTYGGCVCNKGTFTMNGGNICGNSATSDAGGVYNTDAGKFTMNGGNICGNTAVYDGGGVKNDGAFKMNGGSINYNKISQNDGGGLYNNGTCTMTDGLIAGNSTGHYGGGLYNKGKFTMTGGSISGNETRTYSGGGIFNKGVATISGTALIANNTAKTYAGGIYNCYDEDKNCYATMTVLGAAKIVSNTAIECAGGVCNNGAFTMTGGYISSNTSKACGGLYVEGGIVTLGGTAQIYGNTATVCGDNLAISAPITLGNGTDAPADGMNVGVSLIDASNYPTFTIKTGAVTKEADALCAEYFHSDDDKYVVFNTGLPTAMQVYVGNPVVVISETNLQYETIKDAIKVAGTTPSTIKLLCDVKENVTIPAGADITLDLNGHVLDLGGKHILNQGILTIEDSDPDAVHTGTLTDYVGGIITNGNAGDVDPILQGIGGAIVVCKNGSDAALIMNAGTIVNCTALNGGAIFVGEGATFTMNGGTVTHCTAERGGAIGNYKGSATIAGTIAYCTATNYGGAIYNEGDNTTKATTILNDGAVINNCAAFGGTDQMGGGIFNKGTLVMNAGAVIENCTAEKGAGVHNHGADWVTFTMNGGTIQNNTAAKNGGGVQNSDKATFVMNGGTITGNVAKESLAGGVFTKGKMTVLGTASIYGNYTGTSTQKASNLTVVKGYPVTIASNTGLLYVSVIEKDGSYKVTTGTFTNPTATDYSGAFFADDADNYEVRPYRNANGIASMLAGKTPVCEITSEGDYMGNRYDTFKQAVQDAAAAATPTTIKLLQPLDLTETYQLPDYTTVVINDKWIETNSYNLYVGKDCVFEVASQRDLEIALYVVPRNGSDKSYTLKLTQDIHVSKPIKVDYGYFKSLTIDGNGYVFTATASDTAPAQSHVLYFYNDVNFYKEVKLNNVVINVGNGFRGGICVDKTVDAAIIAVDLDNVTIIADRTKAPLGSDMTEKTGTLIQNNGNGILVKGQLKLVTDAYCWSAVDLDNGKGNVMLEFNTGAVISVTDLRTDAVKIKEPLVGLSGTSAKQWAVRVPSSGAQLLFATKTDLNPDNVTGMRCKDGYDVEIHTHNWVYTATGTTITASCAGTAHVCHTMAFATNTSISIKAPTALTYNGQAKNATLIGTSIVGQDALPAITYQYKTGANGAYAPAANITNAGYYKASVTIGDATVYVEYYVAQAAVSEPFTVDAYVYNGSELTLSLIGVQDFMTLSGETKAVLAGPHTVEIALDINHTWADGADGKITWVIDPATAVIDVDTKAIVATYGDIIVLPTASSNVGTVACSATADELINAGTYVVTYRVVTTSNYAGSEKTLTVTILPLAVSEPTVEDITRTYTGEEYVVTVSDVASYVTVGGEVSGTDAGIYVITYTLDNNHVWASGSDGIYTWTIDKANAVIDVDTTAIVKTYGDVWTLPVAVSTFGDVACDKTIADMKNAGTYVVTYTVASTTNYNGDEKTITVTVKPLAVNEPVVTGAYVYDGSEKKAVVSGVADYMTVSGVDKATAAGTYTLTYTLDNNHVWANGSDGIVTWYVNTVQAQIAVDCTPIVVTYGEKVVLPVATSDFGTVVCDKNAQDLVNAGSYVVTYTVEGTADYAGQVAILTVVINPLAVNEPTVSGSYKYDGTPVTITVSGVEEYMTLEGSLTQSAAGVYSVSYTLDNNHVWADGSDGVVTYEIKAASILSDTTEQGGDKPAVIVETEDGFGDDIILVVVVVEATATDAAEKTQTIVDYDNLPDENLKLKDDEKLAVVFDVKLYRIVNGVSYEIQPEDIKPGTVLKVKMLIPAEVDVTKVTRLLHVHAADDIEEIPFDASLIDADGYYTIEIDRLSEIAFIAYKDAASEFIHWIVLALLIALVVFVAILWYVYKIRGFKQDGERKLAPYIGFGLHFVGMVTLAFLAVCALCWILLGVNLLALGLSVALYVKGAKEDEKKNG